MKIEYKNNKLQETRLLKNWDTYIKLVSDAYLKAPEFEREAVKHWKALSEHAYIFFKKSLSKINLVFTTNFESDVNKYGGKITINGKDFPLILIDPKDEYQTAEQMSQSFKETGELRISIDYSEHPIFSVIDNIVFRTVHDYIVHILGGFSFGGKGEIQSYNLHQKLAPNEATPALFTEIIGQASVNIVTGQFPVQKITILKGFDYINLGAVDNENYEIINKVLVKKR